MKAWTVESPGELSDSVRLSEVDEPTVGPGEVAVDVHAAALGYPDYLLAVGRYHDKPKPPFILGGESAGVVSEVGAGVEGTQLGDRVIVAPGETVYGRLADRVVIPEELALPIPDAMPMSEASALFVGYHTAYIGLIRRANLQAGEVLVVNGASGGVGSAAVEIGLAVGARVIAIAGGQDKVRGCRDLGAHEVIDHRVEDVVAKVRERTAGRGADVVLDVVGGDVFDQARRYIAVEGRILVGGFASGVIPTLQVNHALLKNYSVVGFRTRPFRDDAAYRRMVHDQLVEWYEAGRIRPRVYPVGFDEVVNALQVIGDRQVQGRMVVLRD